MGKQFKFWWRCVQHALARLLDAGQRNAVAQFDKAMTVAKLRGARERKRRKTGLKVEGRKSYAEANPTLVELAKQLSEQRPRLSLREISAALASQGFTTPRGVAYSASAVSSMLGR
jgi:hypothetical protein